MATGDQADMLGRLKAVLPAKWFPTSTAGSTTATPILDAVLTGCAATWSNIYGLLQYVIQQSRITTATGVWLDIISLDFFGSFLPRRTGEADAIFRQRIQKELFRPKGTREAVIQTLTDLTGNAPLVFEPARIADTGAWDANVWGYDTAGSFGETDLPFQFFVIAYRPAIPTVSGRSGWDDPAGGWDVGAAAYTDPEQSPGLITDAMIYAAIADVVPAGTIAWTNIQNA